MKQLVHSLPFKIYLTKFDLKKKRTLQLYLNFVLPNFTGKPGGSFI